MKVLVIDIGGTHIKILGTGQKEHREFKSGSEMTPAMMVAGVMRLEKIGTTTLCPLAFPARSATTGRSRSPLTWGRDGSGLIIRPLSRGR